MDIAYTRFMWFTLLPPYEVSYLRVKSCDHRKGKYVYSGNDVTSPPDIMTSHVGNRKKRRLTI